MQEGNAVADSGTQATTPGEATEKQAGEAVSQPDAAKEQDSRRFAALQKQARALEMKRKEIETQQSGYTELRQKYDAQQKLIENGKRNPEPLLKHVFGDNWHQLLVDLKLNDGKLTPDLVAMSLEEKLAALEKKLEDKEKASADEANKKSETAKLSELKQAFVSDIQGQLEKAKDAYPYAHAEGAAPFVAQLLEENFTKTGRMGSTKEAFEIVEKLLRQQDEKRESARTALKAKAPPQPNGEAKQVIPQPRRTLNNSMTASTPAMAPKPAADNEEERFARALARLQQRK